VQGLYRVEPSSPQANLSSALPDMLVQMEWRPINMEDFLAFDNEPQRMLSQRGHLTSITSKQIVKPEFFEVRL
jgi:hypothetical protein